MQKKEIIPKNMILPLVWAVVFNMITYCGSRLLTSSRVHYDLSNSLDDKIPLLPWTVVIYLGCYLFWVINYVIGSRQDEKTAFRFISADFLAKFVCLLCFVLFPTTNVRPAIEGNSVWENLMIWLYRIDPADNLFPSIHCLTSWFCFIAVRKNDNVPKWYKIVSAFIAVSICLSTLTTRQHVLIDVIAGIALAEGSYLFTWKSGFSKKYASVTSRISNRLTAGRMRRE